MSAPTCSYPGTSTVSTGEAQWTAGGSGRRSAPPSRLHDHGRGIVLAVVMAIVLCAIGAVAPSAMAGAVIPTSSAPGESTTVINNYQEVSFGRNDDGSWPCGPAGANEPVPCPGPKGQTEPEAYPFGFGINFFGSKYEAAFVNNNGNITFTEPLSQFTPSSLTTFGSPIIAPYFADVDTRNENSAIVNFGQGTLNGKKVFVVNWPGVGCYDDIGSVLDNFQVILIDRADRNTGVNGDDFDMEFNYDQIQWDTGEASGGNAECLAGTEGISAIAGYTNGSTNHFEIPGSEEHNAFLDSSSASGLIHNSINSSTLGRYIFSVINGAPPAPTTTTTSLSGGSQSGPSIEVPEGTAVTDSATLGGENIAKAEGTVTYKVYSDSECQKLVTSAGEVSVSAGTAPNSEPETLPPGTYYWQARYSGDSANNGSVSPCGSEVETVKEGVTPPPCTSAKGVGHLGQRGKTGLNEDNDINVSGKPHVFMLKETGLTVSLTKVLTAECVAIPGGFEFRGTGLAKENKTSGYFETFAISEDETGIYLTAIVEKEKVVVLNINHQKLKKASKQKFS